MEEKREKPRDWGWLCSDINYLIISLRRRGESGRDARFAERCCAGVLRPPVVLTGHIFFGSFGNVAKCLETSKYSLPPPRFCIFVLPWRRWSIPEKRVSPVSVDKLTGTRCQRFWRCMQMRSFLSSLPFLLFFFSFKQLNSFRSIHPLLKNNNICRSISSFHFSHRKKKNKVSSYERTFFHQ